MKKRVFPGLTAVIGGIGTAVIGIIMNLILIPRIEADTAGIRCFDMNFAYRPETACEFLNLVGDEGRFIYLHRQLPLDFVYPVFYTLLFISLICLLCKSGALRRALLACAAVLAVCDYAENIMSIIMLKRGVPSDSFAAAASCVTSLKTVIMYLLILSIAVLLVKFIAGKRK
ncbi:MAG: hypothetical protein IKI78_00775, partial [Clostridia bacterium]|nr:hypothetical protein [Clostridia bacterium]